MSQVLVRVVVDREFGERLEVPFDRSLKAGDGFCPPPAAW